MQKKIILTRSGLATILASTREVFSNETFGMLLGTRHNGSITVSQAIPHQTVHRTRTSAEPTRQSISLDRVLESFESRYFKLIGDYHSHPVVKGQRITKDDRDLSDDDIYGMNKNSNRVYVIVTAKKAKAGYDLRYLQANGIAGYWGDLYFNLKPYVWDSNVKEFTVAEVVCEGVRVRRI